MAGLNLEALLRLLRADLGAWASLAVLALILGLMAWTSWGSRRALRKCLMLSLLAHAGVVYYGGTQPIFFLMGGRPDPPNPNLEDSPRIRSIEVASLRSDGGTESAFAPTSPGRNSAEDAWGSPTATPLPLLTSSEPNLRPDRPDPSGPPEPTIPSALAPLAPESAAPAVDTPAPPLVEPRDNLPAPPAPDAVLAQADPADVPIPEMETNGANPRPSAPEPSRPDPSTRVGRPTARPNLPEPDVSIRPPAVAPPAPDPANLLAAEPGSREQIARLDPAPSILPEPPADLGSTPDLARPARPASPPPDLARPDVGPLRGTRPSVSSSTRPASTVPAPSALAMRPADLNRPAGGADLLDLPGPGGHRPLADVPTVYRPRLDPNRSARARLSGATDASEQAVERALAWLARHQDADGRWDAGTARYSDGSPAPGEDSFTSHCPPGDLCHGECFYWEADTAVTGLSLLTFLGAGYTHNDGGRYAPTIRRGIDFLLAEQKPNGDLRGRSRAVGMYCHTMASLALSEAYALTGDPALRSPVERAVNFLVEAQYPNLMGWRYSPGSEITRNSSPDGRKIEYLPHPPTGDTSVLGWVVLVLKSANEVGIEVPPTASRSALNWLKLVAEGPNGGLARYQPTRAPDPTMTAEAWVCRQFLGIGGQGPTSTEAQDYLLNQPPSARSFNIYYWYYGTLAMYQHGGPGWDRWNTLVRDQLVGLQQTSGHKAGSWDPDPTRYGTHGGRLYTTALAALTLEVYYRYLRLYDAPSSTPVPGIPAPIATPPPAGGDAAVRRASETP